MGDTIYDGSEDGEKSKKSQGSNIPLFQNQQISTAAWVNVDKNGDFYISINPPLMRSFPIFVKDRFQDEFNEMINHLIGEGKLSREAMKGSGDDE